MPIIAIAGAVAGVASAAGSIAGTVVGANQAASGAEKQNRAANMAADAAGGIATAQRNQALSDRQAALQFAAPTAQEIQQIGDRIQQQQRYQAVQEASLQRDTQVLNSLDPALITAGQQANKLMQGQEASILAPMKQQQQMERQKLQARLSAQLGPGYETSSVGQQALQQFDMQSNMQTQQAQMSAFNQVSQFMGFNLGQRSQIMSQERLGFETGSQMSATTLRAMSDIQGRQEQAILGTTHEMVGTAGSEFAGEAARARVLSGQGQSESQAGGALLGAGISGLGSVGSNLQGAYSSIKSLGGSSSPSFGNPMNSKAADTAWMNYAKPS